MTVHRYHDVYRADAQRAPLPVDAGRHRKRQARRARRNHRVLVAAVMVTVGALGATVWTIDDRSVQGAVAGSPGVDGAVIDWMTSNLPPDVRLLDDGTPTPVGMSSTSIGQPDVDWHDFDYLVTTPGEKPLDTAAEAVWHASVAVAIFPDVQVRRILDGEVEQRLRSRAADRADRLVAGTALLANQGVTTSPAAARRLAEGGLDLRAATALTALAGVTGVEVTGIEDVRAEAAAQMPARSMTVRVVDPGRATAALSGLTSAFRAEQITATPDGALRLHWPLRFEPLPLIN